MSQNSSCYQFHLNRTKLSHGSMGTECLVEIFGRLTICSVPCEHSLSVSVSLTCSTWLNELIDQKTLALILTIWAAHSLFLIVKALSKLLKNKILFNL